MRKTTFPIEMRKKEKTLVFVITDREGEADWSSNFKDFCWQKIDKWGLKFEAERKHVMRLLLYKQIMLIVYMI